MMTVDIDATGPGVEGQGGPVQPGGPGLGAVRGHQELLQIEPDN